MKIAWSGQHTRGKALPILLRALDFMRNRMGVPLDEVAVDVLGSGVMTDSWQHLTKRLRLEAVIKWRGWLAKEDAVAVVKESDIFVITSIKDLTSTVLLEALSNGKPVVCLDHCGFSDVVDETCGIKVKVAWPDKVIRGFAEAIVRMMDDRYRSELSIGALKKAEFYKWAKVEKSLTRYYGKGDKKVLVSVYACSPFRGSEPGMGWHYLRAIARSNEVWAIVEQEKWQAEIEDYLRAHPDEMSTVHWTFIRKPRARLLRRIWPPSYYWFYRIWQWRAYQVACWLNKQVKFDIVHQLNMVGFREPGYLWKLDVPFLWGPVGGLGYTSLKLLPLVGFWGGLEHLVRNLINYLHCHLLVRPRHAARKASATVGLIMATNENKRRAKALWDVDSEVLCEIGV